VLLLAFLAKIVDVRAGARTTFNVRRRPFALAARGSDDGH
jgi:hypothetical protein